MTLNHHSFVSLIGKNLWEDIVDRLSISFVPWHMDNINQGTGETKNAVIH